MNIAHFLYLLVVFLCGTLITRGQAVYYSDQINQQFDLESPFHIIGDIENRTTIYVYDKNKKEHGIYHFDIRMQLRKKHVLSHIPYQDKVLGIFISGASKYLVVHVRQVDSSHRTCYLSSIDIQQLSQTTRRELLSVSHDAFSESSFFHLTTEKTGNYFMLYLLGGHDEHRILLKTVVFDKGGILQKTTRQILDYKHGPLGDQIEGMYLNHRGDLLFYMTARDESGWIRYVKIFLQSYHNKKWRLHYMEIPESVRVYKFKAFFNIHSKTWNLYASYKNQLDLEHTAGFLFRSWSSETSKMVYDVRSAFKEVLVNIKDKIDPYILEDMDNLHKLPISNRSLQDVFSLKEKEADDTKEEEEKEYLDEPSEVSMSRIEHLLQILSMRDAEIIDIIPTNNNQLIVLMEEQSSFEQSDRGGNFFSTIKDNVSVGLNVGLGVGNTYFANSSPILGRYNKPAPNKRKRVGDIIAFSVDTKSGRLSWASSIHKIQESDVGENVSFCLLRQAHRSLLFYVNTYAASFIYAIQITPKGKIELAKTILGASSAYQLITMGAKQVDQTSLILPCLYKDVLVFARILYEE